MQRHSISWNESEHSGSDADPEALELCRKHLTQAGLRNQVRVSLADLRSLQLDLPGVCFVTNPPYGERMGSREQANDVAASLGQLVRRHPGASMCAITSDPAFGRAQSFPYQRAGGSTTDGWNVKCWS